MARSVRSARSAFTSDSLDVESDGKARFLPEPTVPCLKMSWASEAWSISGATFSRE